jgi:EAL and modified HD-GYP domain-containing signal transduction protein
MGTRADIAPSPPAPSSVCVARQPIFDARRDVRGYELLFRSGDDHRALVVDDEAATSGVILTAFTEIGLPRLVGARPAWINISRRFLVEGYAMPLPAHQVVLEILEDVEADEEVLAAARRLRREGYSLALDDFVYSRAYDPLIELADIVKVEVLGRSPAELAQIAALIRRFPGTRLLAEKVETHEQLAACRDMGFDLFQGYVLCKPQVMSERSLAPASLGRLRMISEVLDPTVEFEELVEIVGRDLALSYKLLRYVNSALCGLRRTLDSVHGTLTVLGIEAVRRWVTLILLASREEAPSALLVLGLTRARMCELLAPEGSGEGPALFMTGMFSVLDAIMHAPLDVLLEQLPLEQSIADALLRRAGDKGAVLDAVLAFEQGRVADAVAALGARIGPEELQGAYDGAVEFAAAAGPQLRDDAASV